MKFLIILAAVLLVHHGRWMPYLQHDRWFTAVLTRLAPLGAQQAWLVLVLVVVLPCALLQLLLWFVAPSRLVFFLLSALVLLYAIGRGSWREECARWVQRFSEPDAEVLKQKLLAEEGAEAAVAEDGEDTIGEIWQRARRQVLYRQLDSFYAVVFWFFLLGAPAALAYRLLQLYQHHYRSQPPGDAGGLADIQQLLWLLEWLPVRLMGLLFCIAGNFVTAFWVLRQACTDGVSSSVETLARTADAALFVGATAAEEAPVSSPAERNHRLIEQMVAQSLEQKTLVVMRGYCAELQALLNRLEMVFLLLLAVIALL